MTVTEMHTYVKLELDKTSSLELPAFEPEEIDYWLNRVQDDLIKRKVFGNNPRQEGYGEGIKRMEDLSPLVKYSDKMIYGSTLVDHLYHPNVAYIDIEANIDDYLYYVGADILISDPNAPTSTTPQESVLVEEDVIGKLISTPYNKPALRNCYVYLKEGEVNVIYDPFSTLASAYISYIKKPKVLSRTTDSTVYTTESELPEHVHSEIVLFAVNLMLENIESERFQTNTITLNNQE